MSIWNRMFGKKDQVESKAGSSGAESILPISHANPVPPKNPVPQSATTPPTINSNGTAPAAANRRIRVFISSTFRDMIEERDTLTTQTWPVLRKLCQERHVELVEVDLRWGIAEEQSTRKETLKLCLDEIKACRPFFIGLLGERYGWVPGDDAFTAGLKEEQPWLKDLHGRSVTELEILHGVLNNPDMAGRAFFYFRDPAFRKSEADFVSESTDSTEKQNILKDLIRKTCAQKTIPLHENYPDPAKLAALVLEDLKAAIELQFPKGTEPDPLTKEAGDHEAFAEIRRRTYIGRPDYFEALDRHAAGVGGPLVLLGESGSGKSALLANWVERWRKAHTTDFIFQHYIGGTPDSADHWRLMNRLISEIKRWANDPYELPRSHDDILKDFPVWLAKARIRAERQGVRFIIIIDALNQLEEADHARLLGWLPTHPFNSQLRLIASTLPGDTLKAVEDRGWTSLRIQPLAVDERRRMIADYLARFGKKLDVPRIERLAVSPAAANPLYLKILLDELRVTGTHDRLDERLGEYLAAPNIPSLLRKVLERYQRDYERDRPGLVGEALGLIWAARRGLTETELLQLLKPENLPQLPLATWAPLRAALEEGLVDRGGILNFAHDFLRSAVQTAFAPEDNNRDDLRLKLADYFELKDINARNCDELPWLYKTTHSHARLRTCLLNIDRFVLIYERDNDELRSYWGETLHEQEQMGGAYFDSFELWTKDLGRQEQKILYAANQLGSFLKAFAFYREAELLMRLVLEGTELILGSDKPDTATALKNLADLLRDAHRSAEAEPLIRRSLEILEKIGGRHHFQVAISLNTLALLLQDTNRYSEAEALMRRALDIEERCFGKDSHKVTASLSNLAVLLQNTSRYIDAETLMRRVLDIDERIFGKEHPEVATDLDNLGLLLRDTERYAEAEPLMRRALDIGERNFGKDNTRIVTSLNNLALLLHETKRYVEAEPLMRRALDIEERYWGKDHPCSAISLNNLALLLHVTNRRNEAEPLYRRALAIDERSLGIDHPNVAIRLNNLAGLLCETNRLPEAERFMRRMVEIFIKFTRDTGHPHPRLEDSINNYAALLRTMGQNRDEIMSTLKKMAPELFR